MRGLLYFCVIVSLPLLAAISHDLYIAYEEGFLLSGDMIKFSDLGWVWQQYHLDSYNHAKRSIDPETWQSLVSPILRQPTIFVTGVPVALLYGFVILARVIGFWPFFGKGLLSLRKKGLSGKKMASGYTSEPKKKQIKYKRK